MNLVVASGKGGTGKTTLAVSLALHLLQNTPEPVKLLDCDVEAPNAHISLDPAWQQQKDAVLRLPNINPQVCTQCKRCVEVCRYHALVMTGNSPMLLPQLCHGCGSCTWQCPANAISEQEHAIGVLRDGISRQGLPLAQGELILQEPMAAPVIRQLKAWQSNLKGWRVLDAPPGAACPVVETLRGADLAILVTEPTPFGLHDLKQVLQLVQEMRIPYGVVINRSTVSSDWIEPYCRELDIPIWMRIPFSRAYAQRLAAGEPLLQIDPALQDDFALLVKHIQQTRSGDRHED